jgi:FlaG/FlaF family flagellin (archaellin)
VIGVILIVAISVVLAAVIGATALGYVEKLGGTTYASSGQCGVTEFDPENVDNFAEDRSEVYDVE